MLLGSGMGAPLEGLPGLAVQELAHGRVTRQEKSIISR